MEFISKFASGAGTGKKLYPLSYRTLNVKDVLFVQDFHQLEFVLSLD